MFIYPLFLSSHLSIYLSIGEEALASGLTTLLGGVYLNNYYDNDD